MYLCDTGIFHSVWVAVWSADQTATHTVEIGETTVDFAYGSQVIYNLLSMKT